MANGHDLAAIRGYTLGQVRGFLTAIERRERVAFKQAIIAARVAQYDKSQFKKVLKEIDRGE